MRIPITTPADRRKGLQQAISGRRVFGTWDFKWPQDSVIRVAFQRLPRALAPYGADDDLQGALFDRVAKAASQWLGPDVNLRMEFLNTPQAWWPAPGDNHSASGPGEGLPYDVLVSLMPLDAVREPDSDEGDGSVVLLPRSQLGTYARRVAQRVPTVYLGRPFYMGEGRPRAMALDAYFDSKQFRHCIVHEFGHVLGLAHEHQNPRAEPDWKSVDDIIRIFTAQTGVTEQEFIDKLRLPDAAKADGLGGYVRAQITDPWPCTKVGNDVKFSDWREPPNTHADTFDFGSIMTDPLWRCYVANRGMSPAVQGGTCADTMFDTVAPTSSDLAQLARMYPRERQR